MNRPSLLPAARALRRAAALPLLALLLAGAGGAAPPAPSPAFPPRPALLDRTRDEIVRRAFIPSDRNVHGQVRWIRREGAVVLQTLLYSPMLRRGLETIRRKELGAWPEGMSGREDSALYLRELEAARAKVLAAFEARKDREDPLQKLAIEFVLSKETAFFGLYELEVAERGGTLAVQALRPIAIREVSREYARRSIRIQAEAAFHESDPALSRELAGD